MGDDYRATNTTTATLRNLRKQSEGGDCGVLTWVSVTLSAELELGSPGMANHDTLMDGCVFWGVSIIRVLKWHRVFSARAGGQPPLFFYLLQQIGNLSLTSTPIAPEKDLLQIVTSGRRPESLLE